MAERVLYMRGFPEGMSLESLPEGLVDDLEAMAELSDEKAGELYKHLAKAKGFLYPKALSEAIQKVVKDSNVAGAVSRVILNIGPPQVELLITSLEEKSKEKDFPFDQAKLEHLKQILKQLIQPYPSIDRFRKAERLARITGQQLETIELICDLRPIFDETRKNVEGMMPYTRLHIVATGEDGLPNAFEVELTHQQVVDLTEKAGKAKDKLETLHQSIETWLPGGLPDLTLTRRPRKESVDG